VTQVAITNVLRVVAKDSAILKRTEEITIKKENIVFSNCEILDYTFFD